MPEKPKVSPNDQNSLVRVTDKFKSQDEKVENPAPEVREVYPDLDAMKTKFKAFKDLELGEQSGWEFRYDNSYNDLFRTGGENRRASRL